MGIKKKLGQFPNAKRKAYFKNLKNYKNGQFQNESLTPALAEGQSMAKVMLNFFGTYKNATPSLPIPFVETNIHHLTLSENVLIWFGHSSYFFQLDGKSFLVDPIFSGNASPLKGSVKAFPGTNSYQVSDLPNIDYLIISHDHWDHLDYDTIQQLIPKVSQVICGLGVAQHFEYWGWNTNVITEKNWYETISLAEGFTLTFTPARHFSGRLLARNISLWTSYVLQTPSKKIFLGGDSGYGSHFKTIGDQFGPFDLAILECGQYNVNWPYIHALPNEMIPIVKELKAKNFLPVHHSKFKLAQHAWYEPIELVTQAAQAENISITTPQIGEKVNLDHLDKVWPKWWERFIDA